MRFVRLLIAGMVALAAMAAVALTALIVFLTGLVGLVAQAFRGRPAPAPGVRRPDPGRRIDLHTEDAIEVVTTKVSPGPDDPAI